MKFASTQFAFLSVLAAVFTMALAGCGASDNVALTQGNWSVAATSSGDAISHNAQNHNAQTHNGLFLANSSATFYIGGNLTQNGGHLTGTMYVVGSECFNSAGVAVTGTVSGNNITLTTDSPSLAGQVITVTATAASTSSLTGTYSVTGGCDDGDSGMVTGSVVAPITATWAGSLNFENCDTGRNGCPNTTISIDMTQATTAALDGGFPLTGNITYTGSGCSVSGTITNGEVYGSFLVLNASTVDQDDGNGTFNYNQVLLNSGSTPTSMTGIYEVTAGECSDNEPQTLTLASQ
jgi:hypothetical protein